jgi:hypothetical protein
MIETKTLIGLTEEEAVKLLKEKNIVSRVIQRETESFLVSMDLRDDRVNLKIKEGKVIEAKIG